MEGFILVAVGGAVRGACELDLEWVLFVGGLEDGAGELEGGEVEGEGEVGGQVALDDVVAEVAEVVGHFVVDAEFFIPYGVWSGGDDGRDGGWIEFGGRFLVFGLDLSCEDFQLAGVVEGDDDSGDRHLFGAVGASFGGVGLDFVGGRFRFRRCRCRSGRGWY